MRWARSLCSGGLRFWFPWLCGLAFDVGRLPRLFRPSAFDSSELTPMVPSTFIHTLNSIHPWIVRAMSMSKIIGQLSKQRPKFFRVSYSTEYKTFILNHILADPRHPVHETQKRRFQERPREGLWWHVTTAADLSKSSCVRSWSRRRLRNAIIEELRARGFDENGKAIISKISNSGNTALRSPFPSPPAIQGSLRLHAQLPLIPAKFTEVKAEVGRTIDIILGASMPTSNRTASFKMPIRNSVRRPLQMGPQKWPQASRT